MLLSIICLLNCQSSDKEIVDKKSVDILGVIQKGPFVRGSKISVNELDEKLNMTGRTFTTTIINDKGEFALNGITLATNYVQLAVDGFFFNELSGQLSDAPITLFAVANIKAPNTINVNVLTHLEIDRVKTLVQKENLGFEEAKKQAIKEVLRAFYIKEDFDNAESFDLTSGNKSSFALLSVSSLILNEKKEAKITQYMSELSSDIANNGILDSDKLKHQIDTSSVSLYKWHTSYAKKPYQHIDNIRKNVTAKYKSLDVDVDLTYYERYIDKNGNRDISDNRPMNIDNIIFNTIVNADKADALYFSNEVTLDIIDSVTMWLPSYPMGYKESSTTLKQYFCGGGGGGTDGFNLKLKDKYGVLDKYKYEPVQDEAKNPEYLYLNNGLIIGWYDMGSNGETVRADCFRLPTMHVFINDKPLSAYEAGYKVFTLYKGDKLKVAMNPYHALYDESYEEYYPPITLNVPEHIFKGKTAIGTIFVEGKQVDFKISIAQ